MPPTPTGAAAPQDPMTPTSVVRAEPRDLIAIQALLDDCGLPSGDLAPKLDGFFVARRGSQLRAVVGLERFGESGLLRSLAVAAGHRGRGLGRGLVDHAVASALAGGVRELYLLTLNAAEFFELHGFERVERGTAPEAIRRTTEFSSLCPASAVCMRRRIAAEAQYYPAESLQLRPDVPGAAFWATPLSRVMLTYFEVQPRARFERHAHEAEQITMVLEGELTFECDHRPAIRVRIGEVIAIPSNIPHAVIAGEAGARAIDAWSPPPPRYAAGQSESAG